MSLARLIAVSLAGFIIGATNAPAAEVIPLSPEEFTKYVANQFRAALPDYHVEVIGPLTLRMTPGGAKDGLQANLDRMHDFCSRNVRNCEQMLRQFVTQSAGTLKSAKAPIDAAMLRAVVRPKAYIDALRTQIGEARAAEMSVEELPGDLVIVCYLDFPTAARPALATDFATLGLSKQGALDKAKENVAMMLGSLTASIKDLPKQDIGTLSGNYYESSWFALHDKWSEVAVRFGGELIVAVPAGDKILYAKRSDSASVDAFRVLAAQIARQSDRPISTTVYHWTEAGWEPLQP